ncbi:MAG: SDR family oxidoreductase [Alphaproteobacteria bacterium]|nr:SDR family oxidoreductase [Alphaproteobacteria bacterium]
MSHAPDLSLYGRRALVCGASAGIGRAAALTLAAQGAEITALARRDTLLDALLPELRAAGAPNAWALQADLDDRDALADRVRRHLNTHGPHHILINNTGGPAGGPLLDAPVADLAHAFGRHVLSAHTLVQHLLPGMREAGYGRVINVLSTSVREPIPNLGVSNTTRGAMASWAKSLSRELPPGVTINNILPGFTDTDRLTSLKNAVAKRRGVPPEQVQDEWIAMTPEGRLGAPDELGAAIGFLASPAGAFIRGVSLPVDGGRLKSI